MVRLSNKLIFFLSITLIGSLRAQETNTALNREYRDYKDPKQHERFHKRSAVVGSWQINKLKGGAVVVRLKTNSLLIDALRKAGKNDLANKKQLETYAINKNTMFAYMDKLTFCKVYFISSNYSDSLLHGTRKGVFLDTNLKIDPSIEMKEDFYLIAERDYGYNSSIGFVPEDSASKTSETGNAVRMMSVVLKNKYGHQLKPPFPYRIPERSSNAAYRLPITIDKLDGGIQEVSYFFVNKKYLSDLKDSAGKPDSPKQIIAGNSSVELNKTELYEKIATAIEQLNDQLKKYFKDCSGFSLESVPADMRPFLY